MLNCFPTTEKSRSFWACRPTVWEKRKITVLAATSPILSQFFRVRALRAPSTRTFSANDCQPRAILQNRALGAGRAGGNRSCGQLRNLQGRVRQGVVRLPHAAHRTAPRRARDLQVEREQRLLMLARFGEYPAVRVFV